MFRCESNFFDDSERYTVVMRDDFSQTAALLSDPGRAAMLMALIGGGALPAGQLAMIGNVAPQTASSHLAKLLEGELLSVQIRGRHRYYRLANPEVAHAIEALLAIAPRPANGERTTPPGRDKQLAYARTCYSHLAGQLAVEIADSLLQRRVVTRRASQEFAVTRRGLDWFAQLGIALTERQTSLPRFARCCLDWTERRDHIAGALGALMLKRFRELKWVAPLRDTRALRVTVEGEPAFYRLLHIRPPGVVGH